MLTKQWSESRTYHTSCCSTGQTMKQRPTALIPVSDFQWQLNSTERCVACGVSPARKTMSASLAVKLNFWAVTDADGPRTTSLPRRLRASLFRASCRLLSGAFWHTSSLDKSESSPFDGCQYSRGTMLLFVLSCHESALRHRLDIHALEDHD